MFKSSSRRFTTPDTDNAVIGRKRGVHILLFSLLPLVLFGCMPDSIKLTESAKVQIATLKVVVMEAPPLEIFPDRLESRMPVYSHFDNMVLPADSENGLYRLEGGILVAGHIGQDDSVESIDPGAAAESSSSGWSPATDLMQEAIARLDGAKFAVVTESRFPRLPMAALGRDADTRRWRDAAAVWYERNSGESTVYPQDADAILELAIGRFRINHGQLSLQILMKVIDRRSGRVIARNESGSTKYEAPVDTLLTDNGTLFKSLFRHRSADLLAEAFEEIGLTTAR